MRACMCMCACMCVRADARALRANHKHAAAATTLLRACTMHPATRASSPGQCPTRRRRGTSTSSSGAARRDGRTRRCRCSTPTRRPRTASARKSPRTLWCAILPFLYPSPVHTPTFPWCCCFVSRVRARPVNRPYAFAHPPATTASPRGHHQSVRPPIETSTTLLPTRS